jgi:hypothetical protein
MSKDYDYFFGSSSKIASCLHDLSLVSREVSP